MCVKMEEVSTEQGPAEILLLSARNGDINLVKDILGAVKNNRLTVDIDCKGNVQVVFFTLYLKLICSSTQINI